MTEKPGIEEKYARAIASSNIDSSTILHGTAHQLLVAGLVAQVGEDGVLRPNRRLGHALVRLQTEWHSVAKPLRERPRSLKQWIERLPLIQVGQRQVKGVMTPIWGRDKEGARRWQQKEQAEQDSRYAQGLILLALNLPSRRAVLPLLGAQALHWGWADAEAKVAAVVAHWLDANCRRCTGTGVVMIGDLKTTCPTCEGRARTPVPHGDDGYRLHKFMEDSRSHYVGAAKRLSKELRRGA